MNPIQFYTSRKWRITSDPTRYSSGVWGLRQLYSYGIHVDVYCNGYHPAYDLARYDGAPIEMFADGEVLSGTGWGTFGWQVIVGFEDATGKMYQVIFGHVKGDIPVKVGQKVRKGQVVAYQGASNNLGVNMASHLHIQFQPYKWLNEWSLTCTGINPLKIDLDGASAPAVSGNVLEYDSAWDWTGKVKLTANTNYRIYPHTDAPKQDTIPSGTALSFDRIYYSDGNWWIRTVYKEGIWFVAVAKKEKGIGFRSALEGDKSWANLVGKLDTSGGKVEGAKNGYTLEENNGVLPPQPKKFNKYAVRKNRSTAYFMGRVKSSNGKGAALRKYNGGKYNVAHGPDMPDGSIVFVFQVMGNGFARVYSSNNNGFVHLDQVEVVEIY